MTHFPGWETRGDKEKTFFFLAVGGWGWAVSSLKKGREVTKN